MRSVIRSSREVEERLGGQGAAVGFGSRAMEEEGGIPFHSEMALLEATRARAHTHTKCRRRSAGARAWMRLDRGEAGRG